ncbi:MAG: putative hydrolase [Myxococcaceae bacterium]|nr:putative hydrolase [Myxococcaceae bacterium]
MSHRRGTDAMAPRWRRALTLACVLATGAVVPRALVGRDADALFDGDAAAQHALARAVADDVARDPGAGAFHTGSTRFDGEWALVTSQMAALGLSQVIVAHPEARARYLPAVRAAVDHLLRPSTFAFGTQAWGGAGLEHLDGDQGHAYLGYVALALGALREVDPATPHAALHDRLVAALARRLERAPAGVVETYPGEAYPCDMAAMVGAVGQHARLTGTDRRALLARMATVYRTRYTDPASGYLIQSVDPATGRWLSPPRGSGTALSAYFLSFADASLGRELGAAVARHGHRSFAGFGGVAEYPGGSSGAGDVDSGPVVLGVSVSATGFALASARQRGDRAFFRSLYRTASLFGVPVARGTGRPFVAGGPIGNAILLAMLSARAR